ncbi:MAG: outer membrane beta-barrel protein [Rhodothermales bacterium]
MRFLPLCLLLFAAPLHAQQARAGTQWGIGVRVNDLLSNLASATFLENGALSSGATLLVPINVGTSFRIEPEIGFGRASSGGGDGDFSQTSTQFRTGVGLMKLLSDGSFVFYAGGRLQYTRSTEKDESPFGDDEFSRSVLGIGPVVGGEHYFSSRFSLGGEAGFLYQSYGLESDGEDLDLDLSSINTIGSVFVRFYFN